MNMKNSDQLLQRIAVSFKTLPEIGSDHAGCPVVKTTGKRHTQSGVLDAMALAVEQAGIERGLSPNLGWSHYRVLKSIQ